MSPNVKLTFLKCDISSLASVQECSQTLKAATDRLDILFLNAGIMAVDGATSIDGYEIQWATNQMGHALLVKLLLPLLQHTTQQPGADVRVINLTSIAYQQAPKPLGIDFETLKSKQEKLSRSMTLPPRWARYGQSKLAQLLYTEQLAKHYPEVTFVSVHPGVILTGLFENVSLAMKLPVLLSSMGKRTPVEEGHFNQCWAATCAKSSLKNGEYYEPIGEIGNRTTLQAKDKELGERLWEWTQKELEAFN